MNHQHRINEAQGRQTAGARCSRGNTMVRGSGIGLAVAPHRFQAPRPGWAKGLHS
jgi:hypothetical protein